MQIDDMYEYLSVLSKKGIQFGLDRMKKMLELFDHPDRNYKIIHIAGTNGKGSAASFIHSIFKEAGYRTGLFRSPHTVDFFDRIVIDRYISQEEFLEIFERVKDMSEKYDIGLTIFEAMTLISILYFSDQKCEYVVLEVGMGGRLDSTNAVDQTELSVITKIGMDHMQYLGDTLEEIAGEKAGIIREDSDVILYDQTESVKEVIQKVCSKKNAHLYVTDFSRLENTEVVLTGNSFDYDGTHYTTRLSGLYQLHNAVVAITAAKHLQKSTRITDENIREGLKKTYIPGRFDVVHTDPTMIFDGAHNPDGMTELIRNLTAIYPKKQFVFVIGVMKDKDYKKEIELIVPIAKEFVLYESETDRALKQEQLKSIIETYDKKVYLEKTADRAIDFVLEHFPNEVIVMVGTLHSAEDVYAKLKR